MTEELNRQNLPDMNKKTNILLVEDDPFLVDIYTTKLKERNYGVFVATDGQDAINKVAEIIPDLVILDIVLPKKDGVEVLRAIKTNHKTAGVKVVVLSNLSQTYEVSKAMEVGAASYLIKSHYSPSEVVKEIEKYL